MKKKFFCIWLCLGMLLVLTACGGIRITDNMTPTETVEAFLECIKTQDEENLTKIYDGDGFDFLKSYESEEKGSSNSLQKAFMEKWLDFDYKVNKETIAEDGNTATVSFSITNYDLNTVFNNYYQEYMRRALEEFSGSAAATMTDEALEKMSNEVLKEELDKATEKTFHADATLSLSKRDGMWVVDRIDGDDKEFMNAITGGMITAMDDVANTLIDNGAMNKKKDRKNN